MRSLAVLLILLVASLSTAAEPQVFQLDSGYLIQVINGKLVTTTLAGPAVVVATGTVPTPPVPPTPGPVLNDRAKAVFAAVQGIADPDKAKNAAEFAGLFTLLKQQVDNGKLTGQAIIGLAVNLGESKWLATKTSAVSSEWKKVIAVLDKQWTAQVQDNAADDQLATCMVDWSSGLSAAAPGYSAEPPVIIKANGEQIENPGYKAASAAAPKAFDWMAIIAMIMEILKVLLPLLS